MCILMGLFLRLTMQIESSAVSDIKVTITVSKNGNNTPLCWTDKSFPCLSLSYAMKKPDLNNTRILLTKGNHHLSTSISRYYLDNFSIQGSGCISSKSCSHVMVTCLHLNDTAQRSSGAGLSFQKCSNLEFSNFVVRNCGAKHLSTSSFSKMEPFRVLSTALFLREAKDVIINNITITDSKGIGAVIYDVGGNVKITNTNFLKNTAKITYGSIFDESHAEFDSTLSGGGLYIEFTNKSLETSFHKTYASGSRYTISSSNFLQNIALHFMQKDLTTYSSFGLGGGMSLILRGGAKNNFFRINHCHFEENNALWGAGLFMETHEHAGGNSLYINDSVFVRNNATYGGGGVQIGMRSDMMNNSVVLEKCKLRENEARVGGGFGQYRESENGAQEEITTLKQCIIESNSGNSGSAIRTVFTSLVIINTIILENTAKQHTIGQNIGAVYVSIGSIVFRSNNTISHNRHTAIVLESTAVFLYDKIDLINNIGSKGGALAMYGTSYCVLKRNSTVNFCNNSASKLGGAIYNHVPGPLVIPMNTTTFLMHDYTCNLFFGERIPQVKQTVDPDTFPTQVNFVSNRAPKNSGSAIFATAIHGCRKINEGRYNNTALRWKTFKYSNGEEPYIVTSGITLETSPKEWRSFPGGSFSPKIILLDELGHKVIGAIRITIIPRDPNKPVYIMGAESHLFVVKDNKIGTISLKGQEYSEFSLKLETLNGVAVQNITHSLSLKPCPLGFYQRKNEMTCTCLSTFTKGLSNGVTHCSNDKPHVLKGRWGDPLYPSPEFASLVCPRHYCNKTCNDFDGIDCVYDKNTQCGKNRQSDSILCGKCKDEHSVQLGNEDCIANKHCHASTGILIICAIFIVLSMLVLFVLFQNVDTYSWYFNGFFYSYQIIPLFLHGNNHFDAFISVVIALVTWSGTGHMDFGVCIWKGMTDLNKLAFNYIFPTYLVIFTAVLCVYSNYRENSWLSKHACFRAFAFLSVVAYADFTRITFKLLHRVNVRSGQTVLYYAGEVTFFGKEHLWYAFLAIVVLVTIVILFPIVVMFSHLFINLPGIIKLKGIFDAFKYCFKKKHEQFSGFYFISRLILLAIATFVQSNTQQHTLLLTFCILILVFFTTLKPYASKMMNYNDIILLTNVCIIAGLNAATGGVVEEDMRTSLEKATDVLSYIPLICTAAHLMHWIVIKIKMRKCQKRKSKGEYNLSNNVVDKNVFATT